MSVSHLLDPLPTEIHVFTALEAGAPLLIGTRDKRMWSITDKGIAAKAPIKD